MFHRRLCFIIKKKQKKRENNPKSSIWTNILFVSLFNQITLYNFHCMPVARIEEILSHSSELVYNCNFAHINKHISDKKGMVWTEILLKIGTTSSSYILRFVDDVCFDLKFYTRNIFCF